MVSLFPYAPPPGLVRHSGGGRRRGGPVGVRPPSVVSTSIPDNSSARDALSDRTLSSYGQRIAPARDAVTDPSNSDDDDDYDYDDNNDDDYDDISRVIVEEDSYEGRPSALFPHLNLIVVLLVMAMAPTQRPPSSNTPH